MDNHTKDKIIDAAAYLFHTKGFASTTVREIVNRAETNVSNIAYYFGNKAGLLEYLISSYFEGYIHCIEEAYQKLATHSARECLFILVGNVMNYQEGSRQLTRFVQREMTLDSILIREVMTTYMAKERYYFQGILEKGISQYEFIHMPVSLVILQLKGMLMMPYLYPQYMSEVLHILPYEPYIVDHYRREIEKWVDHVICIESSYSRAVQRKVKIMS